MGVSYLSVIEIVMSAERIPVPSTMRRIDELGLYYGHVFSRLSEQNPFLGVFEDVATDVRSYRRVWDLDEAHQSGPVEEYLRGLGPDPDGFCMWDSLSAVDLLRGCLDVALCLSAALYYTTGSCARGGLLGCGQAWWWWPGACSYFCALLPSLAGSGWYQPDVVDPIHDLVQRLSVINLLPLSLGRKNEYDSRSVVMSVLPWLYVKLTTPQAMPEGKRDTVLAVVSAIVLMLPGVATCKTPASDTME
ncbi:hypothetical protein NM208_g5147 [Fusarium decemcellulare]|uniref:Uncharacterized protein n=1 Tax=Fusarium decemcellulare TaxID=57161 RepID=A0ACC1SI65_9HYPO|nr:hypothetical protein NM208_g5147 [Fusarium decemcellulare]